MDQYWQRDLQSKRTTDHFLASTKGHREKRPPSCSHSSNSNTKCTTTQRLGQPTNQTSPLTLRIRTPTGVCTLRWDSCEAIQPSLARLHGTCHLWAYMSLMLCAEQLKAFDLLLHQKCLQRSRVKTIYPPFSIIYTDSLHAAPLSFY